MSDLATVYFDEVDSVEVKVVTKPKASPVDLKFLKNYMKVETDEDDELITKLILSATDEVERYLSKSIMIRTLKAIFRGRETWKVLPILPAGDISEVKNVDADGNSTIYAETEYQVTGGADDKKVAAPQVMTVSKGRVTNETHVTYLSGYTSTEDIPMPILESLWLLVTLSYQRRELLAGACVSVATTPSVKAKLYPFQKVWI